MVIILVGATVILNWERVRTAYQSTVASLSEMQTVRTAIQTRYDTPSVSVLTKRLFTQSSGAGLPNRVLSIELVNPPFLKNLAEDELENKARDIAIDARAAHPSPSDFDTYEVVLTSQTGAVVTTGFKHRFVFRSDELSTPQDTPQ
jgi:hypothetical protein